jgi:hypothetical protein
MTAVTVGGRIHMAVRHFENIYDVLWITLQLRKPEVNMLVHFYCRLHSFVETTCI